MYGHVNVCLMPWNMKVNGIADHFYDNYVYMYYNNYLWTTYTWPSDPKLSRACVMVIE